MSSPPPIAPQQLYVLNLTRSTGRLTGKHSDGPTRQRQAAEGPSRDADEQITVRNIIINLSDIRWPWQLRSEAENYGSLKSSSFRGVLIVFHPLLQTPQVPNSPSRFLSVCTPASRPSVRPSVRRLRLGSKFYIFMLTCGSRVKRLIIGSEMRCKLQ